MIVEPLITVPEVTLLLNLIKK